MENRLSRDERVLYGCFCKQNYNIVKSSYKNILAYILQSTFLTPAQKKLFQIIEKYNYDTIASDLELSMVTVNGLNKAESSLVLEQMKPYREVTDELASTLLNDIKTAVTYSKLKVIQDMYANDPSQFVNSVKSADFNLSQSNKTINSFHAWDTNVPDMYDSDDWSQFVVKSRYEYVNSAFPSYLAMPFGMMVSVCAPPGCGKSLFCLDHAIYIAQQGRRVHYLALGDLGERDILCRAMSIVANVNQRESEVNFKTLYALHKESLRNLDIACEQAGKISVDDYIAWYRSEGKNNYDVFVLDYDSNLKLPPGDMMYSQYGYIYDALTELTVKDKKLLFIASQPKTGVWNNDQIPLVSIGESARKAHCCDLVITMGKAQVMRDERGRKSTAGQLSICKNRRGEQLQINYVRSADCKFVEIGPELYARICSGQVAASSMLASEIRLMDSK